MIAYRRRLFILELLRKQPDLRVKQIAKHLDVSVGTIRNDLNALEKNGYLTRLHGGAVLNDQVGLSATSFSGVHQQHIAEKEEIAQYASKLVNDHDSLLLDASSTVYSLGHALLDRKHLRIVTNGIDVARLLAKNPLNQVILIGGVLNQEGSSVTGLFSEQNLREIHIQKAFVSCSGFSLERGMTEVHLEEAQLKRKAIESAQKIFALVDSSKFGKEDLTLFARPQQITHLFTDRGLPGEWIERLQQAGIEFTICRREKVRSG